MADGEGSSTEQGGGGILSRPGFVVAAVVVLVVVLLGVVVGVRVARDDDSSTPPVTTPSTPTSPSSAGTPSDASASVCGLPGGEGDRLTSAPVASWEYQGTTAYPTSPQFGPGQSAAGGYRFCFQHSPAGAAVMAGNALAQGSDPDTGARWAEYALGEGPYRDQLLTKIGTVTGAPDTRIRIAGVRVLSYDGMSARVDLATRVSAQNQNLLVSAVYELVWQSGDWKVSADVERPLDTSTIPDLTGYLAWGE